jgi:mannose/cellobiose epimerase-like protein (N-acyl-D-glucosamine 2-epimerase family)
MKRIRKDEFRVPPPNDSCKMERWQKIGGGSFHIADHIIKPNERFWAARESLPSAFMDTLLPLSNQTKEEQAEKEAVKTDHGYKLQPRGGGWFDIVDSNGKLFSQKAMRIEDATKMLERL